MAKDMKGSLTVQVTVLVPQNESTYGAMQYRFAPKEFTVYQHMCTQQEAAAITEKFRDQNKGHEDR